MSVKLTTEEFIARAKEKHGDKFDYSKTELKDMHSKVTITCPIHGYIEVLPYSFLDSKHGCPKCGHNTGLKTFIEKARRVHGDKYDYNRVMYKNNNTKVEILCPKHGSFWMIPANHTNKKQGCRKCALKKMANSQRMSTEDFIKKSKEKHGDKYTYDKTDYVNSKTRLTITCRVHGDFIQLPNDHLAGKEGCKRCRLLRGNKTLDTPEAKLKALVDKYGDKYEFTIKDNDVIVTCRKHGNIKDTFKNLYHFKKHTCEKCKMDIRLDKVKDILDELGHTLITKEYKGYYDVIMVECPTHGKYNVLVKDLYKGYHCPICKPKRKRKFTRDTFIEKAKEVHGDRYEYGKTKYESMDKKVTITCLEHGDFEVYPYAHLRGQKCFECVRGMKFDIETINERLNKLYGNYYIFNDTPPKGMRDNINIMCKKHGMFKAKLLDIVYKSKFSCPKCGRSNLEVRTFNTLHDLNIPFKAEYTFPDLRDYRFDAFIEEAGIIIEVHGEQHYTDKGMFNDGRDNKAIDYIKKEFVINKGCKYIELPYGLFLNNMKMNNDIVKEYLMQELTKVYRYWLLVKGKLVVFNNINEIIDKDNLTVYSDELKTLNDIIDALKVKYKTDYVIKIFS